MADTANIVNLILVIVFLMRRDSKLNRRADLHEGFSDPFERPPANTNFFFLKMAKCSEMFYFSTIASSGYKSKQKCF